MDEYGGILAFCNDVRQQLGRQPVSKLRKGIMGDPSQCVVAGTINYRARNWYEIDSIDVSIDPSRSGYPERVVKTPSFVATFLRDFDLGNCPELEGDGWVE